MAILTPAELAELQAAYDAAEAAKTALALALYGSYVPDQHALHTDETDEEGTIRQIPVSEVSAGYLELQTLAAWQTALGVGGVPSEVADILAWQTALSVPAAPVALGDALTALGALTPAANSVPYFTGADSAGLLALSADVLDVLSATNDADILSKLGITAGTGDVAGPAGGVATGELVLFNGITGKIVKASGVTPAADVLALLGKANKDAMKTYLDITAGGGNVVGPVSSTLNRLAAFADGTGALLKDSGVLIASLGDMIGPASATDHNLPQFNGIGGKTLEDSLVPVNTLALKATSAQLTADRLVYADVNGKLLSYTTIPTSKLAYLANVPWDLFSEIESKKDTSWTDAGAAVSNITPAAVTVVGFHKVFGAAPHVVVTPRTTYGVVEFTIGAITTTGFTVTFSKASCTFEWIAIRA
jgi:hypothetical protein